MSESGGGVSWKDYVDALWQRHHEEHQHLLGEVERERVHVAEEMKKLNELRQEVVTDRGRLSTKEETNGLREALEAFVEAAKKEADARMELLSAAVNEVKAEQRAQRARTAAWLGAIGFGLTALTIVLSLAFK